MIMEWVNKLNVTMNERINVTISNEWKDLIIATNKWSDYNR
jgi:hypothetical protein